jgi:hypothetical protein
MTGTSSTHIAHTDTAHLADRGALRNLRFGIRNRRTKFLVELPDRVCRTIACRNGVRGVGIALAY